jgi:hypothetical protein
MNYKDAKPSVNASTPKFKFLPAASRLAKTQIHNQKSNKRYGSILRTAAVPRLSSPTHLFHLSLNNNAVSPAPRIFSYATFNLSALVSLAEKLRCARCFSDDSQKPMSGSHNWAIVLTFDDEGGDWIFRSPRPNSGFSEHTTIKMIESEVASIKFSKLNGIPVVVVKSHWYVIKNKYNTISILIITKWFSIERHWNTFYSGN